jgi:hypothetical protein
MPSTDPIEEIEVVNAYYDGLADGIRMYAHWKDGVQYVGTTGKTLIKALQENEQKRAEVVANL